MIYEAVLAFYWRVAAPIAALAYVLRERGVIPVRAFLDWFFNRFRASNNFRLAVSWALTVVILVVNLVIFGFGPALVFGQSEEAQRNYNLFFRGQFATDAELASWGDGIASIWTWFWGWVRWLAWSGWFVLLLFSLVYTPVALRDEFGRAWRTVNRRLRERRGAAVPAVRPTAAPTGAAPPPGAGGQPITFWQYLTAEFIGDFLQELIAHLTIGRR
ncbi:MAG: hypothetical protein HY474_00800 [Candidatus Sungbacteria bacterium]|uniref:Uncharacterized protein n=1 Tax=Candidatus Sungiibacteriota bacterium TaxID=2750080 RepID=A0A932YVF5_9BACT|nr:hypothetical protein [Candidatus Sungbacteria bacterium]